MFDIEYERIKRELNNISALPIDYIDSCKLNPNRQVILYGAGRNCIKILMRCMSNGINVVAICDKNKTGRFLDTEFNIISPSDLVSAYQEAYIIITAPFAEREICKELTGLGIIHSNLLSTAIRPNLMIQETVFRKNYFEGYKWAYNFFTDPISRSVILSRIRMYLLGKPLTGTTKLPMTDGKFYFDFDFAESETFVQAGTFDGMTVKSFLDFRGENPGDFIYTFEASEYHYPIAKATLSEYQNVTVSPYGLFDRNTVLYFKSSDSGDSHIVQSEADATEKIRVTSLDNYFGDKNHRPTLIQLDIEGCEKEALLGAGDVLLSTPKLAISVYHKPDDIYLIPQIIISINPRYKSFRLHQCVDNSCFETVLFTE